jgi:hypothetical protein
MTRTGDSRQPGRRLIDAAAKARFLDVLRGGASRQEAAAAAGFPLKSLYTARRRDPVFRLAWTWAMELSVAAEHSQRLAARDAAGAGAPVRLASQGGRIVQRRRMRWVRFTEKRQQIFLDHFAGTADCQAAAAAAGVCAATVTAHKRRNPEFAELWNEALQTAYPRLEAEAVRQRLEAQQRLREGLAPTGEVAQEFERVMKLLARWDRRDGRIGPREIGHGKLKRWSFDEAIEALDKRLRALGARRLPPPEAPPSPPCAPDPIRD